MNRKMSSIPPSEVAGLFRSTIDGTVVRFIEWGSNHYNHTHFCGEVVEPHGDYPADIPAGSINHAWNPACFEEVGE